jgi:hypothetical protein
VAGESAREVAARRRDKARRLNKIADAYERGAAGEARTAHALAMLPAAGWFVLHDVRWPGKTFANIDHVVIGPGGVFVIDSKAWSGRVEVRDGVLRQNGYKRVSAVADAAEAARAVAEQVLGLPPYLAKPVLCFVGGHELEGWARDVMVCTPTNLVAMLVSRPPAMDEQAVRRTLLQLQQSLAAATSATPRAPSRPKRSGLAPGARTGSNSRSKSGLRREAWRLLGGLAVILATVVGVRALLDHSDDVARALTSESPGASTAGENQAHRLGSAQAFPAATGRPPLRVIATQARTVHRIGTLPYLFDGNRFFGVRFSIVNQGRRAWVSQPGTTYEVAGDSITPRRGGSAIRIREGQVLPDPLRLEPGQRVTGYVVFQVPLDEPITAVSMTVGPGRPRTVSWRIERQ